MSTALMQFLARKTRRVAGEGILLHLLSDIAQSSSALFQSDLFSLTRREIIAACLDVCTWSAPRVSVRAVLHGRVLRAEAFAHQVATAEPLQ